MFLLFLVAVTVGFVNIRLVEKAECFAPVERLARMIDHL